MRPQWQAAVREEVELEEAAGCSAMLAKRQIKTQAIRYMNRVSSECVLRPRGFR
jgi:hypothetical protein